MNQNGRPSKASTLLRRAYKLLKPQLRDVDRATFEQAIEDAKLRESYASEMTEMHAG